MPEEAQHRKGREGSRWINERPSGTEVADWFKETVTLPDGLDHGRYVNGVTLIPGKEKSEEVVGFRDNGSPIIEEQQNLVFTPYVKIETRIQYYHDLLAQHDDWEGVIEPVPTPRQAPDLPPGFFFYIVRDSNSATSFVCCSMKVTIFKRGKREHGRQLIQTGGQSPPRIDRYQQGETIIDAAPATKMVAVRRGSRQYVDDNALMKAETGAVGRALGFAGMLIVPGSGVATAEDMHDAATQSSPAPAAEDAQIAAEAPAVLSDDDLKARAGSLIRQLEEDKPEAYKTFLAWAKERQIGRISDLDAPGLKGVIRKVEKELDAEAVGGGS